MGTNTNYEVMMRKYAVSLNPVQVGRVRDEARRAAVKEGRDVTWVGLLRQVRDNFLVEVGRGETTAGGPKNGGSQ